MFLPLQLLILLPKFLFLQSDRFLLLPDSLFMCAQPRLVNFVQSPQLCL
jgi:hypothetical protein